MSGPDSANTGTPCCGRNCHDSSHSLLEEDDCEKCESMAEMLEVAYRKLERVQYERERWEASAKSLDAKLAEALVQLEATRAQLKTAEIALSVEVKP